MTLSIQRWDEGWQARELARDSSGALPPLPRALRAGQPGVPKPGWLPLKVREECQALCPGPAPLRGAESEITEHQTSAVPT